MSNSNPDSWQKLYLESLEEIKNLKEKLSQYEKEETLDQLMCDNGLYKEVKEDWNGYIPGTSEARERGCVCPVLDNEEMPINERWVDVNCPIHGKKTETKWEMNNSPLKWNNDYKFVPAPPKD